MFHWMTLGLQQSRLRRMPSQLSLVASFVWLMTFSVNAFDPPGAVVEASGETQQNHQADIDFFETKIRPVLIEHCYSCHAADAKIIRGGLLVDSRDGLLEGGDSGPAVVPGEAEKSLLLSALKHESLEMPPDRKLPDAVIADFQLWIARGAVDPRDKGNAELPRGVDYEAAKSHWAFQPIAEPMLPAVSAEAWVKSPIDRFVLARLEAAGMKPRSRADKETLIRRASFDLIGLPPTVAEIDAFLADESPEAFEKVVDSLLQSPHYGERWGRHWLDLVRYADSNGADENHDLPNAWHYRDWVVRMINRDQPLDQFITDQLAGDLLPKTGDEKIDGDRLTATGMLVIGPKMLAEQDKDKMVIDIVDEQIDTISRTMLGLTIGCARCHDHKFDPVKAKDYYALAGIFYSTKTMADRAFVSNWLERPLPSAEIELQRGEHQKKIDAAKAELAATEAAHKSQAEKLSQIQAELASAQAEADALKHKFEEQKKAVEAVEKAMPAFTMVMAADEATPTELPIHIRGNHLTLAKEKVIRGVPEILATAVPLQEIPEKQSGRLQLAQWMVSPENPLTARVMVNRIWMWHFGQALMRSPSNFGLRAEQPTHPELLDYLANRLIQEGWSLKRMHRTIMNSSTYQMASDVEFPESQQYAQLDPENRLLWRRARRRLEAEPVRDAILFMGGGLDVKMEGKAPDVNANRRAIYLPINRASLYEMFSTFDYVETANHIEQRPTTTVPHQALFLLNSPMVHNQATAVAKKVTAEFETPDARLRALFRMLYARQPTEAELNRSLHFLDTAAIQLEGVSDPLERSVQSWSALCRSLMAANEFVYID
ncbi:MAG: DUF1549 domain-containing protein [Pirellula sp.]